MNELEGVILAAGRGTRMHPFTTRWPKPILPILAKPLLQHQIEMMKAIGIRKITIVIGHLGYEIVRTLGNGSAFGVEITYIEQTETLGIAHAVGRLESRVQKPFLLCLGDIFFVTNDLESMMRGFAEKDTKAVLASKLEENPEMIQRNFAIILGEGRQVVRVIEKPRYVQNKLKGCGVYLFGLEIFDAIRRTPRTAMRDEYEITEAIQIMIQDGHRVIHAEIIEEDLNLTVPEDLLNINLLELKRNRLRNFFAQGSPRSGKVKNCVIGSRVSFGAGISLENCVVFDDVKLEKGIDLHNAIVTAEGIIQCNPERIQ
jgi:glucose-1-phosphate thymidylyltransferase